VGYEFKTSFINGPTLWLEIDNEELLQPSYKRCWKVKECEKG